MAGDKGPFLTSCIIFFLSIGAAIFQILEEPHWETARARYGEAKKDILRTHSCLTPTDLDSILEVVSDAAGQGVTITGDRSVNSWDWANSVIFASTIVTTIGYGNVAPKTSGGRIFCILYGLCGIPLCLVWISELGSFFGDRAKRLSQVLIRKGLSVKKVQFICTALFLLWGLLVHLLIPPFVFISVEGWSYLEGLYFSFITLTTVGFGDYVAGVNPEINYPRLYRIGVELWIYMGLAWLSLFFSWNVHMVVSAHKKVMRKRRHRHQHRFPPLQPESRPLLLDDKPPTARPTVIDIFNFLSEEQEDYSTVIKEIGERAKARKTITSEEEVGRSKSCSDILALDHSPRSRRRTRLSVSQVFIRPAVGAREEEEGLLQDSDEDEGLVMEVTQNGCGFEDVSCGPPGSHDQDEEHGQPPGDQTMRFNVQNVQNVQSSEDETFRFNVQSSEDETSRFNVQNVQSSEDETSRFNFQSSEVETSRFNVQNVQSSEDETSKFNVQSSEDETSRFNVQSSEDEKSRFNVQSSEDETSRFNVQNVQSSEDETSKFNVQNVQSSEDETSRFNVQNVQSSEDETSKFNVQSSEDETSTFNVQSSEDETSRFNVQSSEKETSRCNVQNLQSPEGGGASRFTISKVTEENPVKEQDEKG